MGLVDVVVAWLLARVRGSGSRIVSERVSLLALWAAIRAAQSAM